MTKSSIVSRAATDRAGRWTPDVAFTVGGWWVRFCWGVTFKTKRFRFRTFYGYRLIGVRLWGGRIALVQWRRVPKGEGNVAVEEPQP